LILHGAIKPAHLALFGIVAQYPIFSSLNSRTKPSPIDFHVMLRPTIRLLQFGAVFATTIAAQSINWVDCSQNVPEPATGLNISGVDLSALPSTLHCGRVDVPMDYSKPINASGNNITLGLAMYRPPNPKGVIFL
jgi:hypothetical protein